MPTPNPQPSLATLTARLLARRAAEPTPPADACPAVEPHEAPSGFRTDTRTTWAEALVAARLSAELPTPPPAPAGWAALTRAVPQRYAVPLCVGNFPQMLGDMSGLFAADDLTALAAGDAASPCEASAVRPGEKVRSAHPELAALQTAAGHRLAGEYDAAEAALAAEPAEPSRWRAAWENERAAVLWERGRRDEAAAAWERLPAGPVKAFNLGVAELFAGRADRAVPHLAEAARTLPESSGWKHLAALYLALAESRG